MKKLIFILLFSIIATASFAQASAASARMFKDTKAWQQREFLRTSRGYTLDTAELYGLIGLSKDLAGHTNWQYSTSNLLGTFSSMFVVLGRTNANVIKESYFAFQTNVRYPSHDINFIGSPTFTNNSIVFNGTTQRGQFRFFREWANTYTNMTPQLLMDSVLNIGATDTILQTRMNMSMFVKDSLDRFIMGSFQSASPNRDWRFFKVSNTSFTYRSFIESNNSSQSITSSSAGNYYSSNRDNLNKGVAYNGTLYNLTADGSYNFGLPRNITSNIDLMSTGTTTYQAGTVYYFDITNRALTADEHANKYNALKEFIRRKTQ
jgi:hypothetical protein